MKTKDEDFNKFQEFKTWQRKRLKFWGIRWFLQEGEDQEGDNQIKKDSHLMFCAISVIYSNWIGILLIDRITV